MANFKGKAIYNPSGKAGEYSYWAVNFYNGCSAKCEYCYNRHGITAKVLGADIPTLKKSLGVEGLAFEVFRKEMDQNIESLRKYGLFFNFVSDPCLPETWALNSLAMELCVLNDVPVKVLTKQTWWVDGFLEWFEQWETENLHRHNCKYLYAFGFTLTGHDKLEPGAATNEDRIRAMKVLNDEGFKTWASIEPIIDTESSHNMIDAIRNHVDLVKIGLQSGYHYDIDELLNLYYEENAIAETFGFKIYWKDSFLKQSGIKRNELPECCVTRDFNIFKQ